MRHAICLVVVILSTLCALAQIQPAPPVGRLLSPYVPGHPKETPEKFSWEVRAHLVNPTDSPQTATLVSGIWRKEISLGALQISSELIPYSATPGPLYLIGGEHLVVEMYISHFGAKYQGTTFFPTPRPDRHTSWIVPGAGEGTYVLMTEAEIKDLRLTGYDWQGNVLWELSNESPADDLGLIRREVPPADTILIVADRRITAPVLLTLQDVGLAVHQAHPLP